MAIDAALSLRGGLSACRPRHVGQSAPGMSLRAVEDSEAPAGSVLIAQRLNRLCRAEPLPAQAPLALIAIDGSRPFMIQAHWKPLIITV
ncbi:hypothetical protein [Burkholderia stagnalis]|nr:hypothetical protein [Burkholderia stagnalis]